MNDLLIYQVLKQLQLMIANILICFHSLCRHNFYRQLMMANVWNCFHGLCRHGINSTPIIFSNRFGKRKSLCRQWKPLPTLVDVHSVNYAARLVHTRRALSSTVINLIRRRFQVKPATLLIPVDLFVYPLVEEFYGTRHQIKWLLFLN